MHFDDFVQTFELVSSNLRGRIVRLGKTLDDILTAHDYPLPVSHLVAETIALTVVLSSMLKYEGIFTFQAQGDGPVKMLVGDMTSAGMIRGCASFDQERFERSREQLSALKARESSANHLAQYLGKGYIAFTVDQGEDKERYQGIVELKGSSMVDCVRHYFAQSEQIGTGIMMAVGKRDERWRASVIMLQHLPEDQRSIHGAYGNLEEDAWRRAMMLLGTSTDDEFLDPALDSEALLLRLFHEEGVRIYPPKPVYKGCRCSRERVTDVLCMMDQDDLEYMMVDGKIGMTCEFCSAHYSFSLEEISHKVKSMKKMDV